MRLPTGSAIELLLLPFRAPVALLLTPVASLWVYVVLRGASFQAWTRRHWQRLVLVGAGLALLFSAFLVFGNLATVGQQRPFGHDEVSILAVAGAYLHGQPMYPAQNAATEYGVLYGPVTFFAYLPPMLAGAVEFGVFQFWAGLALLGGLVFAYLFLRCLTRTEAALVLLGYVAVVVAITATFAWATRGDPWILIIYAIAFWASQRLRSLWADFVLVLCAALLIDLKVVLALPALLPLLLFWQRSKRSGWQRLGSLCAIALLTALPFALPRVDFAGYREELWMATGHGLSPHLLRANLVTLCLNYLAPLMVAVWAAAITDRQPAARLLLRYRSFLAVFLLSCLTLTLSGSKNGAGPWHLMPMVLPCAFLQAEMWKLVRSTVVRARLACALAPAVWIAFVLFVRGNINLVRVLPFRLHDASTMANANYGEVQRELLHLIKEHPGEVIAMGYGSNKQYNLTWMRQVLVLSGEPLLLDANTQNERDAAHKPYAAAFLQAVEGCRATLWLIPRGDAPFSMRAPYAEDPETSRGLLQQPELFPQPLPSLFLAKYDKVPSANRYFDVWRCRAPGRSK